MVREHSIRQMWDDLALPELTRTLRLAIGPTKILLSFVFVVLLCGGGLLMDLLTRSVVVLPVQAGAAVPADSIFRKADELAVYLENPSRTEEYIRLYRDYTEGRGVFQTLWTHFAERFNHATTRLLDLSSSNFFANLANAGHNLWLCLRSLVWAVTYHPFYSAVYFTYVGLLICFFGGAVCRCAALEFARFEKPGMGEALHFAREQWKSLLTAPLVPLGMLTGMGAVIFLVGLAGNIPWFGELLLGLLIGLLYLIGLAMSILLLATLTGGWFFFPAVAYEKTTGLDAIGRAFSYVINQPLWMLFYTVVELILGTLFYLAIRLFVFLFLRLTYTLVSLGFTKTQIEKLHRIWAEPTFFHLLDSPMKAANWSEKIAWGMIYVSLLFIVAAVMALVVSYFFSAITVLYALMRKKVDKIGITQVEGPAETCSGESKDSL